MMGVHCHLHSESQAMGGHYHQPPTGPPDLATQPPPRSRSRSSVVAPSYPNRFFSNPKPLLLQTHRRPSPSSPPTPAVRFSLNPPSPFSPLPQARQSDPPVSRLAMARSSRSLLAVVRAAPGRRRPCSLRDHDVSKSRFMYADEDELQVMQHGDGSSPGGWWDVEPLTHAVQLRSKYGPCSPEARELLPKSAGREDGGRLRHHSFGGAGHTVGGEVSP